MSAPHQFQDSSSATVHQGSQAAPAGAASAHAAASPAGGPQAMLLQLQRLHGNQAVCAMLQRSASTPQGPESSASSEALARSIDSERGAGQGLDSGTLARMNGAFGTDFSGVRVHADAQADRLSRAIEARAFATGRDIFFREGAYSPGTSAGRELLAHELTHVVQQGGAGLKAKLMVSQPGDPQEQEADRVAQAVMAQEAAPQPLAPVGVGVAHPAGGTVMLARDGEPSATPPVAAGGAAPVAVTPADAGAAPTAAATPDPADQVSIEWWVDWQAKETGAPVASASNARTGKDAAYGTLKVLPAFGSGKASTFGWLNAASSGAVHVGLLQQAKGKGGMVSTNISWGKPPSAVATVGVQVSTTGGKPPPKAELAAKQKAASAAASTALEQALALEGGIEPLKATVLAAARAAVGGGSGDTTYDVSADVKLDPKSAYSRAVNAVPYEGAEADDRRTATVMVPTSVERLKGTSSVEVENWMRQTDSGQTYEKDGKVVEKYDKKTTSLINDVTTSFESIFNSAYSDWKSKITKTSLGASVSAGGSIGGSVGAGGEIKDLTLDIGTLLSLVLVENPLLAFAVKKAIGKGTIGGKGSVALEAALSGQVGAHASWTDEDVSQTKAKVDTHIKNSMSTHVRSAVETVVVNKSVEGHEKAEAAQNTKDAASSKKNAASTETVGVKYVIGEPELHISKG